MMSHKVLMYSFKGGAGRTVSSANVACLLAKEMGKRVLYIDLDVESAGASVLFGLQDQIAQGQVWTVQDVLRGAYEPSEGDGGGDNSEIVPIALNRSDFATALWPRLHSRVFTGPSGAHVDFLPSRTIVLSQNEARAHLASSQQSFERLLQKVAGLGMPPEIILFDSAAGQQDAASLGLMTCNTLVVFMRWSRQFVYGTLEFLKKIVCSDSLCFRISRVLLVPTAVPTIAAQAKIQQQLHERQGNVESTVRALNHKAATVYGKQFDWIRIAQPIPECVGLKWDDRVFLLDTEEDTDDIRPTMDGYRSLAREIAQIK